MNKLLEKIETYTLYAVIFLLPLAVFELSPNLFTPVKLSTLVFGLCLILIIKSIRTVLEGNLSWASGRFDFPVLLIAFSYIISTYLKTPNKMEAILLPGTATAIVGGALIYFLVNQLKAKEKGVVSLLLFASAVISSLTTLIAVSQTLSGFGALPLYLRSENFSTMGGYLPNAMFFAVLLPIGLGLIISEKETVTKAFLGLTLIILLLGLGLSVNKMLPGKPLALRLPGYDTSWAIAVESLKESPLLGAGPGNYLSAFNRYRPITFNSSDIWNLKFSTSHSFYLTLLTEVGMLGLAGIFLLFYGVIKLLKSELSKEKLLHTGVNKAVYTNLAALVLVVVLLALLPAATTLIMTFFVILAINTQSEPTKLSLSTQKADNRTVGTKLPAIIIATPIMIISIYSLFNMVRIISAEHKFKVSVDALIKNEGANTYDLMREAIVKNPLVDRYHINYSRVNLALANSMAGQEDLTDDQRAQITQLIQQAIREAKAAVTLNPFRSANWELLAQTYRAIIPLAQGSDLFAVQTYNQAVALDPLNPNLRIALGGLYFAAQDYDTATRIFELAVASKPDFANARYNLAFALKEKGDYQRALNEMSVVLSLVDKDSPDYELAKSALEDLESKAPSTTASEGTENLTPPQAAQEQVLQPPVELSEQEEPPVSPENINPEAENLNPEALQVIPTLVP